jgi:positive regulator of sigma E activity
VSVVVGVVGVVLFLFTEDMSCVMGFVDVWIIAHVILLVVGFVSIIFLRKYAKKQAQELQEAQQP